MQMSSDEQADGPGHAKSGRVMLYRLGIGLLQGLLAWRLWEASDRAASSGRAAVALAPSWAATHPMRFAALTLCTAFLPLVALAQVGSMRARRLLAYLALAGAALAALCAYDIWRNPSSGIWQGSMPRSTPSFQLICCSAVGLFIVNQLLEHRARGHALYRDYFSYFEQGWLRISQLALAALFSGLSLAVLALGAALFALVGMHWLLRLLAHPWFSCVEAAMVFAVGVHVTDVRPSLLRGTRNLLLGLLAWLLPLVVLLGWGFLAVLPFTTLRPLWNTRFAAALLLWAVAGTLVLLNAAYKDGDHAKEPAAVLRWSGRAAGPMMLIFSIMAGYAIGLRVAQYGWTTERVLAMAVDAVALLYGAGYAWAALRPGPWLRLLEPVNIGASLFILAVLVALLTPLADPGRLAVDSQLARLREGKVSAQTFDFSFLRLNAGRYGQRALHQLAASPDASLASLAQKTLAGETGTFAALHRPALSGARIYPPGAELPADFRARDWSARETYDAACLINGMPCEILALLPQADGPRYLLVHQLGRFTVPSAAVFARDAQGRWTRVGTIGGLDCPGVLQALREGQATPLPARHEDLQVLGVRLRLLPSIDFRQCPASGK